jgi:hypothetical protein
MGKPFPVLGLDQKKTVSQKTLQDGDRDGQHVIFPFLPGGDYVNIDMFS